MEMIYTERTKRAMKICLEAHAGQVDKGGYPYCMHPIHLAEQMDNESACIVALLHDVLEDCEGYTLQNLAEAIPLTEEEKNALFLITHIKTEPYPVYCKRLSSSPLARQVKIADLRHNLDLTRLGNEPHPKYEVMKGCLEDLLGNSLFCGEG